MSKDKSPRRVKIADLVADPERFQFLVFGRYLYGKKAGRVNRKAATTIEILGNDLPHAIERLKDMCSSDDGQTVQFQVMKRILSTDEQAKRAVELVDATETEAEAA